MGSCRRSCEPQETRKTFSLTCFHIMLYANTPMRNLYRFVYVGHWFINNYQKQDMLIQDSDGASQRSRAHRSKKIVSFGDRRGHVLFPMRIPACQSALFPLFFPFADRRGSVWISPLIPFTGQLCFHRVSRSPIEEGLFGYRRLSRLPVIFVFPLSFPFANRGGSGSASILASRSRGNRIRCQRILLRLSLRQPLPDRPHSLDQ